MRKLNIGRCEDCGQVHENPNVRKNAANDTGVLDIIAYAENLERENEILQLKLRIMEVQMEILKASMEGNHE
jgi:hypothetical protein